MEVTLKYLVSREVIWQEQIATGESVGWERRSIVYDLKALTPDERTLILDALTIIGTYPPAVIELRALQASKTNGLHLETTYQWLEQSHVLTPAEGLEALRLLSATGDSLLDAARAEIEHERVQKERYTQRIASLAEQFLSLPREQANALREKLPYNEARDLARHPDAARRIDEWSAADKAAAQAAADASHLRKQAQIQAWVAEHGSPSQRERLAAGLLPGDEIVNAMRDAALESLSEFPLYVPLSVQDIDHDENCCAESAVFESCAAPDASALEFEALKRLRALIPDANVGLRRHTGTCNHCDATAARTGLLVVVVVGEFEFRREYAVPVSESGS